MLTLLLADYDECDYVNYFPTTLIKLVIDDRTVGAGIKVGELTKKKRISFVGSAHTAISNKSAETFTE